MRKADPSAALIAQARNTVPNVSQAALTALRKLTEYNDSVNASGHGRVSADAAIHMLRTEFNWPGRARGALDSLCRRQLGRKSYGTP